MLDGILLLRMLLGPPTQLKKQHTLTLNTLTLFFYSAILIYSCLVYFYMGVRWGGSLGGGVT